MHWVSLFHLVASLLVGSLLLFYRICGVQHIQRASTQTQLNMFDAIYFVIVTFSTVGYGDISPDIWPSQVFMLLMICIAFAFIPTQVCKTSILIAELMKISYPFV